MQAAGPVAGFTTDILGIGARRHQMVMRRSLEITIDFLVALFARLGADIRGPGDLRWRKLHTIDAGARHHANGGQSTQQQQCDPARAALCPVNDLKENVF